MPTLSLRRYEYQEEEPKENWNGGMARGQGCQKALYLTISLLVRFEFFSMCVYYK